MAELWRFIGDAYEWDPKKAKLQWPALFKLDEVKTKVLIHVDDKNPLLRQQATRAVITAQLSCKKDKKFMKKIDDLAGENKKFSDLLSELKPKVQENIKKYAAELKKKKAAQADDDDDDDDDDDEEKGGDDDDDSEEETPKPKKKKKGKAKAKATVNINIQYTIHPLYVF